MKYGMFFCRNIRHSPGHCFPQWKETSHKSPSERKQCIYIYISCRQGPVGRLKINPWPWKLCWVAMLRGRWSPKKTQRRRWWGNNPMLFPKKIGWMRRGSLKSMGFFLIWLTYLSWAKGRSFSNVPPGRGDVSFREGVYIISINFLCWTASTPNLLHEPVFVAWDSRSQQNVKHVILVVASKHLGLGGMLSFRIQMKSRIFGSKLAQHAEHSPWNAWILFDVSVVAIAREKKTSHQKKDHGFVECFSTWAIQEGCPSKTIHTSTVLLPLVWNQNIIILTYLNLSSQHTTTKSPTTPCLRNLSSPVCEPRRPPWFDSMGWSYTCPAKRLSQANFFEKMRSVWGGESIRTMKTPKSSKIRENWISIWMPLRSFTTKGELQSLLQSAKIPMDFVVVEVE